MRPERFELPLRIVVVEPLPGLALAVDQYAGQPGSEWAGRVKVPLSDIDWTTIDGLSIDGGRLSAFIAGRSAKGDRRWRPCRCRRRAGSRGCSRDGFGPTRTSTAAAIHHERT